MTLTIPPIAIWFIAGFIAFFASVIASLYAVLYYRPKVNRYKKLLIKRGWIQKNEYSEFAEWEHPQKGQKMFYTACCEEAGKKINI